MPDEKLLLFLLALLATTLLMVAIYLPLTANGGIVGDGLASY